MSRPLSHEAQEIVTTLEPLADCGWLARWQQEIIKHAIELVKQYDHKLLGELARERRQK